MNASSSCRNRRALASEQAAGGCTLRGSHALEHTLESARFISEPTAAFSTFPFPRLLLWPAPTCLRLRLSAFTPAPEASSPRRRLTTASASASATAFLQGAARSFRPACAKAQQTLRPQPQAHAAGWQEAPRRTHRQACFPARAPALQRHPRPCCQLPASFSMVPA